LYLALKGTRDRSSNFHHRHQKGGNSVSMLKAYLPDIEEACISHPIFHSPLLKAMRKRSVSRATMRNFVREQFYISRQFARLLAILYGRIEDIEASAPIIQHFLIHEHWGNCEENSHPDLYVKVLRFFRFNPKDLKDSDPLPETKEFLNFRIRYCMNEEVPAVLGAIALGLEFINTQIFTDYHRGMLRVPSKLPNAKEAALQYFRAHMEGEDEDYRVLKNLMRSYGCVGEAHMKLVREGAMAMLDAREKHFNKLYERWF
jgi:pyrroloquinoline quinone (PQQ) biosynthesis protein C